MMLSLFAAALLVIRATLPVLTLGLTATER
jgi:hypothetical protein